MAAPYRTPTIIPKWALGMKIKSAFYGMHGLEYASKACLLATAGCAAVTFCISIFELHLYAIVRPEVIYLGKWGMSYEFVYSGTPAVRSSLIFFSLLSATLSVPLIVAASILWKALTRTEAGDQDAPGITLGPFHAYLVASLVFIFFRTIAYVFSTFVNDPAYAYWIWMFFLNSGLISICIYSWLVVWTLYLEIREDLLDIRMYGKRVRSRASLNADGRPRASSVGTSALRPLIRTASAEATTQTSPPVQARDPVPGDEIVQVFGKAGIKVYRS